MADETYDGDFYCMKCKAHRTAKGEIYVKNNRRMAKSKCPECGSGLNRILGRA
uniref:DUF5679 domain-containing protein n=1 Tax=Vaginimicrobium propionicum TaxID=1871034 RepID=UPI00156F4EC0|nr:DUF5679 domain-containing protein [Vaginimicrobium propionicum]